MFDRVGTLFDVVVNENYCDWGIFNENVRNNDSLESFKKKLEACETREDVQKLVNQYI